MITAKHITLTFCAVFALAGCEKQAFRHELNPMTQGHHVHRYYEFYQAPDYSHVNELYNGFPQSAKLPAQHPRFLDKKLWQNTFQNNLQMAIRHGLKDHDKTWDEGDFLFKFNPSSEIYFASYTQTLCRQGTLSWAAKRATQLGWYDHEGIYCQIGPQHEWLPITR